MFKNKLNWLNWAFFFENQQYLLPVTLLFYMENGLTIEDYIFFQSLSYIMYVIIGVPAGYIADHFSKKYILITGCLLNFIRLTLWISCRGYWIILAGETLMVIIRIFTTGMTDSYIYEYLKEKDDTSKTLLHCGKVIALMSYGVAIASLSSPFIYEKFGVTFLLGLEMILTTIGILMLTKLPKTQIYNRQKYSIVEIKNAFLELYNSNYLRKIIMFNILAYIATTVFVSIFQPLMKLSAVPVVLFGFIYFFNQTMRGVFSRLAKQILSYLSFIKMLSLTSLLIFLAIGSMVISFTYENPYFSLASLIFVCLVIGMQLANQVIMVSEIHHNVASNVRATSISVFNMLCRGLGGIVLGIFKNVSSSHGFNNGFAYLGIIFIVIAVFLIYEIKRMNIANIQIKKETCDNDL